MGVFFLFFFFLSFNQPRKDVTMGSVKNQCDAIVETVWAAEFTMQCEFKRACIICLEILPKQTIKNFEIISNQCQQNEILRKLLFTNRANNLA